MLGKYGHEPLAIAVYGVHVILIGVVLYVGWTYATRHHHLVDPKMSHTLIEQVAKYIAIAPVVYLFAILAAFVNPTISLVIFGVVPLYYILQGRSGVLPGREEHIHAHGDDDHAHE